MAGASVNVGLAAKGWRFWTIFFALAITSLLAAVESTVTSTAMPAIARALDSGELYVWFANAYTLTRLVPFPHLLPSLLFVSASQT